MIKWSIVNCQFEFSFEDGNGRSLQISDWPESEVLAQLSVLRELADNGFAQVADTKFVADADAVLRLEDLDKRILSLPEDYVQQLYIASEGQLNQPEFLYRYSFFDFVPGGNLLTERRDGPFVNVQGKTYLLNADHFELCNVVDDFNWLPESQRTFQYNLQHLSRLKELALKAGCALDEYLSGQELLTPKKIKADFNAKPDGTFEVFPVLESDVDAGFLKAYDTYPTVRGVYPVATDNGTTRVLLDEEQQDGLQKIKKVRRTVDKDRVREIVENPHDFFSPETDLSEFYSERVVELGIYKPKFYPFVSAYQSEWIPGMSVVTPGQPEQRIPVRTEVELDELRSALQVAEVSAATDVTWGDSKVLPVEEARQLIQLAEKQFQRRSEPVEHVETSSEKKVLIIYDNAEALDYAPANRESGIEVSYHGFVSVPNLVPSIKLKEHQVAGVAWLQTLCKSRYHGCLLADDMGLGKTLQLLYFIEWHAQRFNTEGKPYLVVAPVSLLENWDAEYNRFFHQRTLSINLLYGGAQVDKALNRQQVASLQKPQLILTNYETLRGYQLNLCAVDYAVVVLDEAQKIKTPGTLVTNVAKALKADFKIAMTGTPIENTFVDLWCIMDFSVPGLLGFAKDFTKRYQDPLSESTTDVGALGRELHERLGVFFKRRLKVDVLLDLPPKIPARRELVMPALQLERYKKAIGYGNPESESSSGTEILRILHEIRNISDHPMLANDEYMQRNAEELIAASAKLELTIRALDEIEKTQEKVIVFADRKATQRMLQQVVYERFNLFPSIINGDSPTSTTAGGRNSLSRQQTIDKFSSLPGFAVIIMSPLAAGVGLNVTAASHVIHYSRHWNPAKEEQATDRAYRIGQTKSVHVYYPMAVFPEDMVDAEGKRLRAFDEVLDDLLARKMTLASATLYPTVQAEVRPEELAGELLLR